MTTENTTRWPLKTGMPVGDVACLCLHQTCVCEGWGGGWDGHLVLTWTGQCPLVLCSHALAQDRHTRGANSKAFFKQEGLKRIGREVSWQGGKQLNKLRFSRGWLDPQVFLTESALSENCGPNFNYFFQSCSKNSCTAAIFKSSLSNRISFYG